MSEPSERCAVCGRGHYRPERVMWIGAGATPVIVENVPASVCDFCGDRTFARDVARELDRLVRQRPVASRTIAVPVYDLAAVPMAVGEAFA